MLTVIIGGSSSGKSAYAEDYAVSIANDTKKYYLATMQVYGEEGKKKVERHRTLRAGKGFVTLEYPRDIENIDIDGGVVLLECMSNLAANEMFRDDIQVDANGVAEKIVSAIKYLKSRVEHLIIVTNNVFEDGITYDASTMQYLQALSMVNMRLAQMADEVVEVIVGIPVKIKEI